MLTEQKHVLSVAPMMGWTDRHFRYLMRLVSPQVLLYTEMVTSEAVVRGDVSRLLAYDPSEHPIALQLGGGDPETLAKAVAIANAFSYDEINLNIGCPSDRVQSGQFGACLMREPDRVADCVRAMREVTQVPVTIKTRIGVDHDDSQSFLFDFIEKTAAAGCSKFIVHARKAWLNGLSPKENREVPALNYDRVYEVKNAFPDLEIILNGGILEPAEAANHLNHVDGIMIGRAAYQNPLVIADMEAAILQRDLQSLNAREVVLNMKPYVESQIAHGQSLHAMARHMLGLFQGEPGARAWRRSISENAHQASADFSVIEKALEHLH